MSEPFVFDPRCDLCKEPFGRRPLRNGGHLSLPPPGHGGLFPLRTGPLL